MRASLSVLAVLAACASAPPSPHPVPAPPGDRPAAVAPSAPAPPPAGKPTETRAAFVLHKFMNEVGVERDTYVTHPSGAVEAKAVFAYSDRHTPVSLAAVYQFSPAGALERYVGWGWTSRFTQMDERIDARADGRFDVRVTGEAARIVAAKPGAVAAPGYAPMLSQELFLRAWQKAGRPATLPLLEGGELQIESRGKADHPRDGGPLALEHLSIRGLVWGREDVWINDQGELIAVVTRDAEFDHHEAARAGFQDLLPQLAAETGSDGVAWLASIAKAGERGRGVVAFVGGTLIDGTGRPAVGNAAVVVDGDRIVAAGPRDKVAIPTGATTIDVTGKSILPGLWDMHAHVEQVEQGAVYLAAGVTTVRDMGNVLEFIAGMRDAIASGNGLGPRVLMNCLVDGAGDTALGVLRIKQREDIAPLVERLKKAGCVEFKTYSSLDPKLIPAIIAAASKAGMRVVGHVPVGMTSQQAVDAGYASISHLPHLFDAARDPKAPRPRTREEYFGSLSKLDFTRPSFTHLVDSLVKHHVAIDDTSALNEENLSTAEANAKQEPGIAKLPRELLGSVGGMPPDMAEAGKQAFARQMEALALLHKRGVRIVAGTDIAIPGHSLHRQLELYVQAGFTPIEAIQAATLEPARHMKLDKELGTVEVGKRADLVIVSGDPLANISDIRKTSLVVTQGRVYDTATLWKLVGFQP